MGKRALVVVDEGPDVSDLIQAVLKSAGMDCVTLTKSADAPILLSNESFGLLVLDLHTLADAFALARLARESGFNRVHTDHPDERRSEHRRRCRGIRGGRELLPL